MIPLPENIKAITFDVGGTLMEAWPSVGQVYADEAAHHGFANLSPEKLNTRFDHAWQTKQRFGYTRKDWAALVKVVFAGLVPNSAQAGLFARLYERFTHPDAWRIYADVFPTLNYFRQNGYRLGIISNWDDRLRPLLVGLELLDYFDPVLISGELGVSKPDPGIFHRAAQIWVLPTSGILHVGDAEKEDFEGAMSAGCHARLLQRRGIPGLDDSLTSLRDLWLPSKK